MDIDVNTATLARIYDYMLGGAHNFAVDREAADRIERAVPGTIRTAWENRAFLRRAVQFCTAQGIDQFLDIGSGIPTEGNVHEIARSVNPDARVVYVDLDPVAVMQSRTILEGDELSGVVNADLRQPEAILDDPATRSLIDFDRPVAVLLVALLHVIPDSDGPAELLSRLTAHTVPGSCLVLTHFSSNYGTPEQVEALLELTRNTTTPLLIREPDEILALLGDFVPTPPGLVPVHEWRPEQETGTAQSSGYAVVARKEQPPGRTAG
ncbi:SAM-dependent methyltransferase [Pseudonocardia spinosispora]|uniref:SAM-dependent methyltransferase n=1 Tax=Pseudonocardia spinosispora TaxID=103441 RepID=UPI000401E82D|nr:SAM-dependent methyltransferase [Pseudonocardia spinosispora]